MLKHTDLVRQTSTQSTIIQNCTFIYLFKNPTNNYRPSLLVMFEIISLVRAQHDCRLGALAAT